MCDLNIGRGEVPLPGTNLVGSPGWSLDLVLLPCNSNSDTLLFWRPGGDKKELAATLGKCKVGPTTCPTCGA